MARKPRIHYSGATYHVIVRGNNREPVFKVAEDKAQYLFYLERYKQKFQFSLYAYVLMDNHVHLLVSVNKDPLAKIMQGIQQSYTQYYNRKYARVGHIFEQRYKAKLCDRDAYLMTLLRYIHQNPVRALISQGVEYAWSSHAAYRTGIGGLVDLEFVLLMFDGNKKTAIKKYLASMEHFVSEDEIVAPEEKRFSDIKPKIEEEQQILTKNSFAEVLEKVSKEMGVAKERILRDKHDRRIVEARDIIIYVVIELGVMTKTEVSRELPLSLVGVIKSYDRIMGNKQSKQKAEEIKNSLVRKA